MLKYFSFLVVISLTGFLSCLSSHDPGEDHESGYYKETHRPQFHFSPDSMWMNDPNGMVYYDGEYHLFYQFYPDSNVWGPMHWGHTVSTDLVHWTHLPIALYPDSLGYIFSGSAVMDWENTSGLGKPGVPAMVAIFTHHDTTGEFSGASDYQCQSIAYSLDSGRTWTKYAGNPVISNPGIRDFRDPKVFWYEPSEHWVMILAVADRVQLYTSSDLIVWELASEFGAELGATPHGGVWECPDLFELTVEGEKETRWVMLVSLGSGGPNGGSATQYFVGSFDGERFVMDDDFEKQIENVEATWIDFGKDNYAGVTWSDLPPDDGRRIFIGWMSNWQYAREVPTERWRSAMTLPRSLHLANVDGEYFLKSQPVTELQALRQREIALKTGPLLSGPYLLEAAQVELKLSFAWKERATPFGIRFFNTQGDELVLSYDPTKGELLVDRRKSGLTDFNPEFSSQVHSAPYLFPRGGRQDWHLFLDESSVEWFIDDGKRALTELYFASSPYTHFEFFSEKGGVELTHGEAWHLSRTWPEEMPYDTKR